jgi:hypothetical protein
MEIHESEMCPSSVGHLFDEIPKLTPAMVRPYAWANLLYRGATRPCEVVAALAPVCSREDMKIGNWEDADPDEERTWAEVCAEEVLGEMLSEGLCRYNEDLDIWVLTAGLNKKNVPIVIGAVTSLNAQMPKHLLVEIAPYGGKKIQGLQP